MHPVCSSCACFHFALCLVKINVFFPPSSLLDYTRLWHCDILVSAVFLDCSLSVKLHCCFLNPLNYLYIYICIYIYIYIYIYICVCVCVSYESTFTNFKNYFTLLDVGFEANCIPIEERSPLAIGCHIVLKSSFFSESAFPLDPQSFILRCFITHLYIYHFTSSHSFSSLGFLKLKKRSSFGVSTLERSPHLSFSVSLSLPLALSPFLSLSLSISLTVFLPLISPLSRSVSLFLCKFLSTPSHWFNFHLFF